MSGFQALQASVIRCRQCPRLVRHREAVAKRKKRQYKDWAYWGRPVPSLGDPWAKVLIIGLAPAAHGGNRTGRIFTGDRSGDWLFRALYETGFANQPHSTRRGDGLALTDCYITAIIHCAPPGNKPSRQERLNCQPFLQTEIRMLKRVRVIVALGRIAFDGFLDSWKKLGRPRPAPRPVFAHARQYPLEPGVTLIACYHPSQQNTLTGRLTRRMLKNVFLKARRAIGR